VRAWLSQSFEHRRVVDGVVALVGVEFGSRLELAGLHLDLRIEHRLVRLVAIDEDRQLSATQLGDQLELLRLRFHLGCRAGAATRSRRTVQVLAIRTVRARRSEGEN